MEHVLDNPAWNAMVSGNRTLVSGNDAVKYFDIEVSPIIGLKENTTAGLELLHDAITDNIPRLYFTSVKTDIPPCWKLLRFIPGLQMVSEGKTIQQDTKSEITPLTAEHVAQMVDLTQLTNPGPFNSKTIEFGHYVGVFDGDRLVAMAGQRLNTFNYAEISAVCTHPDYLGKGYAKQLLIHHVNRIVAAGEVPFLHVRDDNERAINVYESLGFTVRIPFYFYVIAKN